MNPIEQVTSLKSQGKTEQEIAKILRQQGVSPKQITDALAQSQVKKNIPNIQNQQTMQPSIMQKYPQPPRPENFPDEEETYMPEPYPLQQMQDFQPQNYQSFQQDFPQPEQDYDAGSYETGNYDSDTMIDIAEQVLAEKMASISKQLDNISQSKILSQEKIKHVEERLAKIESTIDKLQLEILKKVSSYGDNLQSIKNEMSMMQDSFGKIVNSAVNKASNSKKK